MPISETEKLDIKLFILSGMGLPMREIAARLGREMDTLYKRQQRGREAYGWIEQLAEAETERTVAARVQKIEAKADIKGRIHQKSYRVIERALDEPLRDGEMACPECNAKIALPSAPVNSVHMKAAEIALDRNEGKPLDRRTVVEREERLIKHEVLHHIDAADLLNAVKQMERLATMRGMMALPPASEPINITPEQTT